MWKFLGVYAFAVGYTAGRMGAIGDRVVRRAARPRHDGAAARARFDWREILAQPAFFVVYAAGLGLNIMFTRAYATHAGPGMAAALDYCMRGVGVPLAILVNPISNSLLPEIARLRSLFRLQRSACDLIDRTIALAALAAVGRLRLRAALPPAGDRAAVPARQLHGGIDADGLGGLSGARPEPGGLEPDRDLVALPLRLEPALATRDRGHRRIAPECRVHQQAAFARSRT